MEVYVDKNVLYKIWPSQMIVKETRWSEGGKELSNKGHYLAFIQFRFVVNITATDVAAFR